MKMAYHVFVILLFAFAAGVVVLRCIDVAFSADRKAQGYGRLAFFVFATSYLALTSAVSLTLGAFIFGAHLIAWKYICALYLLASAGLILSDAHARASLWQFIHPEAAPAPIEVPAFLKKKI